MPRITDSVFEEIVELWEAVNAYHGRRYPTPERVAEQSAQLDRLLLRVIRADKLEGLPSALRDVAEQRIQSMRLLGDYKMLRRARRGLTRGVERPLGVKRREKTPREEAREKRVVALADEGCSQAEALRRLIAEGWLGKTTRQNFNRWLARRGLRAVFEPPRRKR